jgi:hypothetical protein
MNSLMGSWLNSVKQTVPAPLRTKTYPLRRQLWQRWSNPTNRSRPVFLIGCGRYLYSEDHGDAFENWRLRDLPTIATLVRRSNAKIVLFKPILDTHLAGKLLNVFPDARLLFVFRHYHDVINSSIQRFGPENWKGRVRRWIEADFAEFSAAPPSARARERIKGLWRPDLGAESAIALYWLFYNSLYYDLGLCNEPQVRLIQYETLVSSSHAQFDSLCRFLGIPLRPQMIEGVFSSSVARQAPAAIAAAIATECEELWHLLEKDARDVDPRAT